MKIVSYNNCSELIALGDAWNRLSVQELRFVPSFAEMRRHLQTAAEFRLLTAIEGSQIVAVACFIYRDTTKRYEIATRKLFDLPVREVSLFGECVAGRADEDIIRKFFHHIVDEGGFDVISVGEIFVDSPLYRVITSLRHGFVAWCIMRNQQLRWMIRLPSSFDEYFASLRPTARAHVGRDVRRFDRATPEYRVMHRPEDVDNFLRDAETISRLTYQWNIGYGVRNNQAAQERLSRIATDGTFRGYIAYIAGKPCAFGWGELCHRTFGFRATGYDPQYRHISPGTALILHIVRDLIENSNCKMFDFWSGGESGYKSRLANVSLMSARMQVAQISRPYPLLIFALDKTINLAKRSVMNFTDLVLGEGALRQRLKRVLRSYGVGTY